MENAILARQYKLVVPTKTPTKVFTGEHGRHKSIPFPKSLYVLLTIDHCKADSLCLDNVVLICLLFFRFPVQIASVPDVKNPMMVPVRVNRELFSAVFLCLC